ncbi:MAG: TIGR03435 family protein [Bryobacteraceae bacterium]
MKNLALSLFAFAGAWAQTTGATFEVATIKPSPPNDGRGFVRGCKGGPGSSDPELWRCTNATITSLVTRAYDIKHYQLTAPEWMANTNFEISAKLAHDTTNEQFREMIRNLLAERFKLEFHWTKREMPMYDLLVAKGGPKLQEWVDKPASDPKSDPPGWGGGGRGPAADADGYPNISKDCNGCMSINAAGKARYHASKTSAKDLADMLGNQLSKPVNDKTGLTAKYDITLSWNDGGGVSRRAYADADADVGLTMEAAVQQQLGLKLESKKGMVDIIVVDKAERTPTEN